MISVPIFDTDGNRVGDRLPMVVGNRYKVFLPAKIYKTQPKGIKTFHEKIVKIISLSKNVPYVWCSIEEMPSWNTWLDPNWLFTIDPAGNCICETTLLMTSGCRCGGK